MKALRAIAAVLALGALAVCLAAPLRVFLGGPTGLYAEDLAVYLKWFNGATVVWFLSAPFCLIPEIFNSRRKKTGRSESST